MRRWTISACMALLLSCWAAGQQAPAKTKSDEPQLTAAQKAVLQTVEAKVRAEWDALKNRDKKGYGDLLTDDFVAVESDNEGERDKYHVVSEIDRSALRNYTFFGFRPVLVEPDNALVTYEITMEFPPKSTTRFLRIWIVELWVRRNGTWKARYYQETKVK